MIIIKYNYFKFCTLNYISVFYLLTFLKIKFSIMKKIYFIILTVFFALHLNAQEIVGQWNGILQLPGASLHVVFHVSKDVQGKFTSTMDSPDQGVNGIPVTTTTFADNAITFEITPMKVLYKGTLEGQEIFGTFSQSGHEFSLNLDRKKSETVVLNRPQEPKAPFPYNSEEVKFTNTKDKVTLAGTLTIPQGKGKFPVVVLISGSGPQDRNEEIMGHKPFLLISDYLTRNGIAVLRYDERGIGESTGNFDDANSIDLSNDVEAALEYLKTRKDIQKSQIGLIGHSEGGMIAPLIAARNKDVAFIVMLAGPGVKGSEILLSQQKAMLKASGLSDQEATQRISTTKALFEIISNSESNHLDRDLNEYIEKIIALRGGEAQDMGAREYIEMQLQEISTPWMCYFIKHDPAPVLSKVKVPVLALNGSKDIQVQADLNLPAIKKALASGGNKKVTIKEYPNLNHLFQEAKTGFPDEYFKIEQTFSPEVLKDMSEWIKIQVK